MMETLDDIGADLEIEHSARKSRGTVVRRTPCDSLG